MQNMNRLIILLSTLLTLVSCAGGIKSNPSSLVDTQWKLLSINGVPFEGKSQPTISFNATRASGFAGCNRYFSNYIFTNQGQINFDPIARTKMLCHKRRIRRLERHFIAGLRTANAFSIYNGILEIKGREGILQFEQ